MDRPAAPTLDGLTLRRYHYWIGSSGEAYAHSVFAPAEKPYFACSALVLIACDAGRRTVIDVVGTGVLPELYFNGRDYARALASGVSEIHVHFADDARAAQAAAVDIAAEIRLPDRVAGERSPAAEMV